MNGKQLDLFTQQGYTMDTKNEATFNDFQKFVGDSTDFKKSNDKLDINFLEDVANHDFSEDSSYVKSIALKRVGTALYLCAKIAEKLNTDLDAVARNTINRLEFSDEDK